MNKSVYYRIHKAISVIVFIPVVMWVLSGVMHPLMSHWFSPKIAKRFLIPEPIDSTQVKLTLKECLDKNDISCFDNSRFISFQGKGYYQVFVTEDSVKYINTHTGKIDPQTDIHYAKHLARIFLGDSTSIIKETTKVVSYTTQYKSINRLLPVWRVVFDRPDGMELYVETNSSRLGTFNDSKRRGFIWVFNIFHNWGFIPGPDAIKLTVILLFSGIIFFTGFTGLLYYLFNWKSFRTIKVKNPVAQKRKQHRVYGIVFSLFVFMFSFSGFYHALSKLGGDDRRNFYDRNMIETSNIQEDVSTYFNKGNLINYSLAQLEGEWYYRLMLKGKRFPSIKYVSVKNGTSIENGDIKYATHLATTFAKRKQDEVKETILITRFKGEYGFVNKRLPVLKVQFKGKGDEAYYIETLTGKLAAQVKNGDRAEGYSFALLHKFHFLDGLGKNMRDIIIVFCVFSILFVSILGMRIRKRKTP